jgi:hypothetical protein
MSFCDHCQGQRFDRAQVLRALRGLRTPGSASSAEDALALAIAAVRALEIPHLESADDLEDGEGNVVH